MPPKTYLPKSVAERRHRLEHARCSTALNSFGVEGGLSPMWCDDRDLRLLDRLPDAVHRRCWRSRSGASRGPCPGESGMRNVVSPSAFSSLDRAAGSVGVPPVDEPDARRCGRPSAPGPRRCARCRCGSRAHGPPGPANRTGRGPSWGTPAPWSTPSESSAASRASTSPVCEPGTGSYWVSTSMNSRHQDRLAVHPDHPAAVDVHDARRPVLHALGEPLVEDVVGQRDVVVGGEDLGPGRQPEVTTGAGGRRSFGAPKPAAG